MNLWWVYTPKAGTGQSVTTKAGATVAKTTKGGEDGWVWTGDGSGDAKMTRASKVTVGGGSGSNDQTTAGGGSGNAETTAGGGSGNAETTAGGGSGNAEITVGGGSGNAETTAAGGSQEVVKDTGCVFETKVIVYALAMFSTALLG